MLLRVEQGLALVALILGIIGGVLLASEGIGIILRLFEGDAAIEAKTLLVVSVGAAAIVASVIIWTGRYVAGGSLNIILGILMVFYGEAQQGLIILVSGILGVVAPKIKD
jgi:hypothetical protein